MSSKTLFRTGIGLLLGWMGFNLALAVVIILLMLIDGSNPPGIYLIQTTDEVIALPENALNTMRSLAMLMNGAIVALCVLGISIIKFSSFKKDPWAYWAIAGSFGLVQVIGFVSDSYLGDVNFVMNSFSLIVLIVGLMLTYPFRKA